MAQLSLTVNPRQPGTLPNNTVQNLQNNRCCMAVTTRVCKQTINPPMLSSVENGIRGDDEVLEVSHELE